MNRGIHRKRFSAVRGVSLIELTVAVFIIALGVTVLMGQMEASYKITTVSRETNKAMAHLQAVMEKVIAVPFSDVVDNHPNGGVVSLEDGELEDLMDGEYLTVSYEDETADPLQITITVHWTSFNGRECSRRLTTMKTR